MRLVAQAHLFANIPRLLVLQHVLKLMQLVQALLVVLGRAAIVAELVQFGSHLFQVGLHLNNNRLAGVTKNREVQHGLVGSWRRLSDTYLCVFSFRASAICVIYVRLGLALLVSRSN